MDGDHRYELNGDDSRSLATVGAFRVVAERDLRDPRDESADTREPDLRHLRHEGLMRSVALDGRERALTLTERGHHLLEAHRRDRDEARGQAFYAGVSRPRELSHDVQLYRAYLREERTAPRPGRGDPRASSLDHELKREYQQWLQEHNRGRPDSDGRPDRDPAKSKRGRVNTTCRTSTSRSISPISASSTNWTDATVTRTSRWSPSTTAAPTPRVSRARGSDATAAVAVAVEGGRGFDPTRR